jgi:hypothetical protein
MTQPAVQGAHASGDAPRAGDGGTADQRSLAEIVADLWQKTETLLRQEMRLGIAEADEKVRTLKQEAEGQLAELKIELTAKVLAGGVLFAGLLSLCAALILLLAEAMMPWLAALIVGVVLSAGAAVLLRRKLPKPRALLAAASNNLDSHKDTHTIPRRLSNDAEH